MGKLPSGVPAHIGTADVDLVIGLALGDESAATYKTLQENLTRSGFQLQTPSFRWAREVEGHTVNLEFLCETEEVEPGRIFRPKVESTGSKLGAFNVRGAQLCREDFIECPMEGERLDGGGRSVVSVRVANILPFVVLKTFAFQDRHANKDAYDLVFTLLNYDGGPDAAGQVARLSPIAGREQVREALALLAERYSDPDQDGPSAYAGFLANDADERVLLRRNAVATVKQFLESFNRGSSEDSRP